MNNNTPVVVYHFGKELLLSSGDRVILLAGMTDSAFVEFSHPVEREVKLKDGSKVPLGKSYKAWIPAIGFRVLRDRDGAHVGITNMPEAGVLA